MSYPMSYMRLVKRNGLEGDYGTERPRWGSTPNLIAGDLRRLEADQRDEYHLARYAERAGITPEQVKAVLDLFFTDGLYVAAPAGEGA